MTAQETPETDVADLQYAGNDGDGGDLSKQKTQPDGSTSDDSDVDESDQQAQRAALTNTKSLEERVSLPREILSVGCICLAMFSTQAGLGVATDLIHVIGKHFDITNPGILSWFVAGYSLTVGTFILFTGRVGDLYGWKRMFVIGFIWYAVWSLVCGLAYYSNHVLFVFARVLQGIGPAIVLPNGLALLGALYQPGKRQNMAFAVFGACAPTGSIFGSAIAAVFWLAWWPWAFFSFAIALAIIAGVSAVVIPDPQDDKPGRRFTSLKETVSELDLYGAATGIAALVLFNFAWNQAPIVGWNTPEAIVCLILGVLLVPLFFYLELKISSHPILPLEIFNSSNAFVLACIACGWSCFGIWYYYVWQFLEVTRGLSPLLAIAWLSPVAISGTVAAICTGILLGMLRPAWIMVMAMSFFLIGICLVSTAPAHQVYWAQLFVATIVAPFGMDMSFPSATVIISRSVKKQHQGVAASLVNTIVNYSISLGLGFAGTIEVHVNRGGKTPGDVLFGYRAAMYFGIGLAAMGMIVSLSFLAKSYWDDHKRERREEGKNDPEVKA